MATATENTTYSIKTAARLVDMNSHTIRAWERRYKALDPVRNSDNNRRQYTEADIKRLALLTQLVKSGHQISHIASLSNDILSSMTQATPSTTPKAAKSTEAIILDRCLAALRDYELVLIQTELESARQFLSTMQFLTGLAIPLVREVGLQVASGQFNFAQEHAFSSILRSQMMQTLFNLRNAIAVRAFTRKDQHHGLTVCLATRDGDLHEFGILAAAILVANHGHIPHYFGPNLPAHSLADAATAVKADIVLVGNTAFEEPFVDKRQESYLYVLKAKLPIHCEIWWGGYNAIKDPSLSSAVTSMATLEDLNKALLT
jgi:MerR family transcriptional regulator, light-induced transcriptional regulator